MRYRTMDAVIVAKYSEYVTIRVFKVDEKWADRTAAEGVGRSTRESKDVHDIEGSYALQYMWAAF